MLGALVTSVQEEKVHLESELAVSALPVLPVLMTSKGSWGWNCNYALCPGDFLSPGSQSYYSLLGQHQRIPVCREDCLFC